MNLPAPFSSPRPLIEPLEQRIAPALLVSGANLLGGSGNPSTGETSIGGNSVTLVKVLSGNAIVWFEHGLIDTISVGPNTSLDITGDVGTIIGNLTASGQLSDSDNNPANGLDGDVLLPNNITGITTHPLSNQLGTIGDIITGGSISNLNISGNLIGAYAGNGAFHAGSRVMHSGSVSATVGTLDLNPILPGVQSTFTFASGNAKTVESGASISNVKMGGAEELQMFAGSGFAGATGKPGLAGGSISGITIESAFIDTGFAASTPSYYLLAGDGGHGTVGGAGGGIQKIIEVSSTGNVDIIAGQGGAGSVGAGGPGGSIRLLDTQSASAAYTVHAGKGGAGAPGGAGGSVIDTNFSGDSPSSGIIVHAPFTGGANDDVLLVDSGSGNMVVEKNNGNGFTPVVQDNVVNLTTIAGVGTTPVAAIAVDVNGDGLPDIVVAYKNSSNLGVYINQGGGVFYTENFNMSAYTGNTLDASSVPLPFAPTKLAAGNFTGDSSEDLAVLTNNSGQSDLITLTGDNKGDFTVPTAFNPLPSNAVDLVAANIQNKSYSDLIVGFKSGAIDSLLANGSTIGAPFNVVNGGLTVAGGIANLDYNSQADQLLALNTTGTAITLYSTSSAGALTLDSTISLTSQTGTALVAHFVPNGALSEPIDVLSALSTGARLDTYTLQSGNYAIGASTQTTQPLKNFVPVTEGSSTGIAAVGGSLDHFAFSLSGAAFINVALPFSGKTVGIVAGDGGDGIDVAGHAPAHGGVGGTVFGTNIQAGDISILAGNGGASQNGAAGAGGGIFDSPVIVTAAGTTVQGIIQADSSMLITAGFGGTATGTVKTASGGAGGEIKGLNLSLQAGTIQLTAGAGGDGGGGAGGAGGTVIGVKSLDAGGDLTVVAGQGGDALGAFGNGGLGGSILSFSHQLTLTDPTIESPFAVALTAGAGGTSVNGFGGAGGSVDNLNLVLQPSNESVNNSNAAPSTVHTNTDSTLSIAVTAGDGGAGASGGAGGILKAISATAVYNQLVTIASLIPGQTEIFAEINPVTAQLTSGSGGAGSKAVGGAGGYVSGLTLTGISHFDTDTTPTQQPLVITSGHGGAGATKGGAGGAIFGVTALNAQFSTSNGVSGGQSLDTTELSGATIISGYGGAGGASNGGAGGTIANLSIGVQGWIQNGALTVSGNPTYVGGEMNVQSGNGGAGGGAGKGGAAGLITNSTLGCVDAFADYGILLKGGIGGNGGIAGGTGGAITNLVINAPQNPTQITSGKNNTLDTISAIILGGNGGQGTGATSFGGLGGSVSGIVQTKDVNSAINLIQAGNGGAGVTTGGLGGSVTAIRTAGLIGQASDDQDHAFGVFQTNTTGYFNSLFPGGIPQGIFAGRGGTGATAGLAGSVTSISAAQIAAIGAAVDSSGLFGAAEKIANITAQSIAYDANSNGVYNNVPGNALNPAAAVPIDGFIFSQTVPTGIKTSNANLQAFTFVA
jgi:hypothetical protein